ncbi:MAG: hypothetical protein MUC36_09070 [Planctomycetes bacterium]|jgi:streptogramin lyase|nr:hypothetical protein [Planctomycetota bacterium]
MKILLPLAVLLACSAPSGGTDEWILETVAGTGVAGFSGDGGPATLAQLDEPFGVVRGPDGALWFCECGGQRIRKITADGRIHHVAGTAEQGFTGNGGPAPLATLSGPKGIAMDAAGNAWLADTESHSVRMVEATTGKLLLMAGTGERGDGAQTDPRQCRMARLHGIFVDLDGAVYLGDSEAHRVRVLRRK